MNQFEKNNFSGRQVLGVDLDGVCCDYVNAVRPYAAKILRVDPNSLTYPNDYNLVRAWGFESYNQFKEMHREAVEGGIYRHAPILPGTAQALQELSEAGIHIRIVTHRLLLSGLHLKTITDTAHWLEHHNIPYMSLCFTGLKDSVSAHAYIEDAPSSLLQLQEQGIPTFVYDQPYNRTVPGPRIISWLDSVDTIIQALEPKES